ncbi:hypothetical protein TPE_2374 [Treponema pedis str. T A4]|uniref:Uncharacterized protein n=1 Tax=Treponema pedis str. T A4 TaxID=1291379 RepID=S6A1Q8_9SPIR|nr:hypothetical protein TPE_2374 [Treponema pedis str. T A4]
MFIFTPYGFASLPIKSFLHKRLCKTDFTTFLFYVLVGRYKTLKKYLYFKKFR